MYFNQRIRNNFFYTCVIISFLFFSGLKAQYTFSVISSDKIDFLSEKKITDRVSGLKQAEIEMKNLMTKLRSEGYLLASCDSIVVDTGLNTISAKIFIGEQFKFATLRKGNVNVEVLSEIRFNEKIYAGKNFNPNQVSLLMNRLLSWYEDHGYPFVKVSLDSVLIKGKEIDACLHLEKNRVVVLDSILVQGGWEISRTFLFRYLGLWPGDLYNETAIRGISGKLKQLAFVTETKPVMLKLTDRTNKIILFAKNRNASQFDGIIGLLPSATGKTVFTGDAKIKLQNAVFRSGEIIELNWRRLQSETQDLKTRFIYSFPFGLPSGVDHSFKLYKKDTTFLDVLNNLGIQYYLSGLNGVKAFYRQRNSSILSTSQFTQLTTLPEFADITTRSYGLGIFYEKLDYKLNPRKGVSLQLNISAGGRNIRKNPKLNEVVYSGLALRSDQYQGELELVSFLPVKKNATLKFGLQGGFVESNQLFRNELFRVGGLKTLRGFDEESLFVSTFCIGTLEYRFLFEQNSALFLFGDVCWYERNLKNNYATDLPIGVGAGINFETKAGIFSLNYALGNQYGNGFDFRSGKIHFGIVNAF